MSSDAGNRTTALHLGAKAFGGALPLSYVGMASPLYGSNVRPPGLEVRVLYH